MGQVVVEGTDYDQALETARLRVPTGWRIIALRGERVMGKK